MHPIYETDYLGSKISVYPLRVITSAFGMGETTIPIAQIASVELGMMGLMKITIETTGGKKYAIACWKKKEVRDAIYKAQEKLSAQ